MTDQDLIEKLAVAVASHITPSVPRDIELWDFEAIAAYFRRPVRNVREHIAILPSFPSPIRLPTLRGKAHPLYKAEEVIKWAESHQERKKAA